MPSPTHRVVVPVHIPELTGYFENLDRVLQLSLDSLLLTGSLNLRLSVIANACDPAIVNALTERAERGEIDQLIVYSNNRGKVDSLLGVLPRCQEDILTLADADVLFRRGWQGAVERIFRAFPECGWVSPVTALLPRYHTSATLAAGWLKGELVWDSVAKRADLLEFAQSVGDPDRFNETQLSRQLAVSRGKVRALVGGGHFVASLRREAAEQLPKTPTGIAVAGGSEAIGLDQPIDDGGFWRLSTTRSYALHMGNVLEPRFHAELDSLRVNSPDTTPLTGKPLPAIETHWSTRLATRVRSLMARAAYRRLVDEEATS